MNRTTIQLVLTICFVAWATEAWCQTASHSMAASMAVRQPLVQRRGGNPFGDADRRMAPLTLGAFSWTSRAVVERKPIEVHDTITVLVDESASASSEGEIDRRKKADSESVLKDWILIKGLTAFPDPQSLGDPTLGMEQNKKYRAEGGMETSESVKLSIQCEVVQIYPNGLLLLEGRKAFKINSETWETYHRGIYRPEDILPNNSVESQYAFQQFTNKQESGAVRDGYRLGWLQKWMDRYQF